MELHRMEPHHGGMKGRRMEGLSDGRIEGERREGWRGRGMEADGWLTNILPLLIQNER